MPSIFGSLIRAINKKDNKLNILCINNDEPFQYSLAKTGHNFYYLSIQQLRNWDQRIRPIPHNVYMLNGNDLNIQLSIDLNFDIILCQNRIEQYSTLSQISRQLSCPIIMAENSLSYPGTNPFYLESLADQKYNLTIFNFDFICKSWGFDQQDIKVKIIPPGIDTDLFIDWSGKDNIPLTVARRYREKNKSTGFELFTKINNKIKIKCIGDSPGISLPTKDLSELVRLYQNCSMYINTSSWQSCPLALLEAMSTGCPVISTSTTVIPEIIKNGNNGFISNDENEIIKEMKIIIENKILAKEIGIKARETIKNNFNENSFISKWNDVFSNVVGKPCELIVG